MDAVGEQFLLFAGRNCLEFYGLFLFFGGCISACAVLAAIGSEKHRATFFRAALAGVFFGFLPFFAFNFFIQPYFASRGVVPFAQTELLKFVAGIFAGLSFSLLWLRTVAPWLSDQSKKFKRGTSLERNKKTDVRKIGNFLPAPVGQFNPVKYWAEKKGFFLGLDESKKPVYFSDHLPHVQVAGTTGSGKGVFLSMLASQCAWLGEPVIFLDPKDDEWAPHVLANLCQTLKIPFHLVDLRPAAAHQFNFFEGATKEEVEELFLAGFSLSEKGSDSDFYTIADRQAAGEMAAEIAAGKHTPASLHKLHGEALAGKAAKFAGMLREMAEIACVNARPGAGLDFKKFIASPGVIYVLGSMRNAKVIRLQRMLLIKVIQLAEARDRTQVQRKICVVLDEAKYHLSRPALEALGAARDKGVHVVLAHQSLDDLRDCPADLSPDAVVGAVMENCALKLVYRVQDPTTAEWFARKSGRIEVDNELRRVSMNAALAETVDGDRVISQAERFLIDENMILNLHSAQGVLFGHGLPKFIHTSPITIPKLSADQLRPQSVAGDRLPTADELISLPTKKTETEAFLASFER